MAGSQLGENPLIERIVRNPEDSPCSVHKSKALKKCREHLVRSGDSVNIVVFKELASHENFLNNFFQLFDEDGDGLIDQDEFLQPFHQRLTDDRGRQFCEVLETATFAIAVEQFISPSVFGRIFATKGLLDKLFRLMDKNGDNVVTITEAMDLIAKLTVAQAQTSLTKENLEYLTKLFAENCTANNEITLENFRKIIRSKNVFFTERVFHIFDRDGSGTVSMQEFLDGVSKFSGQSMDNKIKFLFDIYDLDGDGRVQMIELRKVMQACMDENGMKFSEEQLDDLTTALFEDADPNDTGAITVEALKAQLEKHEGLLENLSYSIEKWLVPPKPVIKTKCQKLKDSTPHQLSWQYMKNNNVFLIFLFVFLALNLALFVSRMWQYRENNIWVQLARGCGQCLNFTCMFILVCMLRKCITLLRALGVSSFLPLDEHIYFHKLTGWLIVIYSVGHTIAHIINLVVIARDEVDDDDDDDDVRDLVIKYLFTTATGIGWIGGSAFPTGVALLVILVIMVICSQNFVRKNGNFEVFYWTHRLYIAFFILTFVHGPRFWHWFIVPGTIFAIELMLRFVQRRTGYGRTYIEEAVLLPSKVTHLVIKRPPNFHFHPGDYVFIKVPTIAKYEWHPFTISSAPEQDDVIWLHIRGVGEWTNQLHTHINKQLEKLIEARNATTVEIHDGGNKRRSIFSRGSRYIRSSAKKKLPINGDVHLVKGPNAQGYENIGYGVQNGDGDQISTTNGADNTTISNKRLLSVTKSLPVLDKEETKDRLKLVRTSSHQVGADRQGSGSEGGQKICVRSRSMGQSFRHMRRKPKTLPMPGLSSVIIQEEDESVDAVDAFQPANGRQDSPALLTVASGTERLGEVQINVSFKAADASGPFVKMENTNIMDTMVCYDQDSGEKPLDIIIDGPYGAPSSHIFRAEHAVLIGTGIGVTPFASILQSIMRRYWDARLSCPKCQYRWTSELPGSYLSLKKVDFFWINRDQKSFEWFVNLLSQLEIEQAEQGGAMERFLDMHMYITSALQKTDMKAVGLHLALDLLHEKEKRDLITGLKTRTQAGRPNWNKVFRQIAQQKKGKITVFFCGPPQLARTLKLKCDEFGFSYKKEIF